MDGRASGILAPKLRIYSSGSPTQPYAECVSDFNCFQSAMSGYPPSVRIGQYFADVLPLRHEVAENATLKISFSHTIRSVSSNSATSNPAERQICAPASSAAWQAGIGAKANHFHSVVVHMPRRAAKRRSPRLRLQRFCRGL